MILVVGYSHCRVFFFLFVCQNHDRGVGQRSTHYRGLEASSPIDPLITKCCKFFFFKKVGNKKKGCFCFDFFGGSRCQSMRSCGGRVVLWLERFVPSLFRNRSPPFMRVFGWFQLFLLFNPTFWISDCSWRPRNCSTLSYFLPIRNGTRLR